MKLLFTLLGLAAGAGEEASDRAARLHRDALVFDAHVHMITEKRKS